jgi:hypothetical protein
MATAALVDRDIEIGRRIVAALTRAEIPVTVSLWGFVSDEWLFIVATPIVDSKGSLAAYRDVNKALQKSGLPDEIVHQRVFLMSPNDRELKRLEKESREAPYEAIRAANASIAGRFVEDAYLYKGFIDILRESPEGSAQDEYLVIYTPGSGGTAPIVRVHGIDPLRDLLERKIGLRREITGSALKELAEKGDTVIPNVQLRPSDLKRLGLA